MKYNSSMITMAFQPFSSCLFIRDDQLEFSLINCLKLDGYNIQQRKMIFLEYVKEISLGIFTLKEIKPKLVEIEKPQIQKKTKCYVR